MIASLNKYNLTKINILNYLISLIPLSLILGNLATNLNIVLICILGFLTFGKEIFFIEEKKYYLVYFFFIYLIFTTFFNNFSLLNESKIHLEHLLKSFFYLRFLIVFLVVSKLIESNKFNTNIFFLSCAFFSIAVSVDIIIQFIFKKNILGYPITNSRPSSFFNEENIAGGFLQRFSLFLIFFLAAKKKNYKNLNSYILFLLIIFFIPILLTSNRMPALIFAMCILFYFLIEKKLKEITISSLILISIFFFIAKIPIGERLNTDFKIFIKETKEIILDAPKLLIFNKKNPNYVWHTGYIIHFNSGVQLWKENKILGSGLRSFRINCSYSEERYTTCNTHPHNYFIEIMVDTGIIGIITIYSIFFIGVGKFFKNYFREKNISARLTSSVFFLLVFFEFFPIRSTGSFFTTNNSIFIFLMLAFFLNLKNLKKLEK